MAEEEKNKERKGAGYMAGEIIPNPPPGSIIVRDERGQLVTSGVAYERIYDYKTICAPFGFVPVRNNETGEMRLRVTHFRDDKEEALLTDLDARTLVALRACIDLIVQNPAEVQIDGYV